MRQLKILLVDDNENFRKSASEMLALMPNVARVECASSASEALAQAGKSHPHLVLTDIVMPAMSGFELIRRLRAQENPPHIVALTLHNGTEYDAAVRRCGADGLLPKHEFGARIPELIASLAGGDEESAPFTAQCETA